MPFSLGFPLQTRDPQCSEECQTDGLLFHTPIAQFLEAKRNRNPSTLEWGDDGCSVPVLNDSGLDSLADFPEGFNFLDSCKRHDFGYYNYRRQNRCNEDTRGQIDLNFQKDLNNECKNYSWLRHPLKRAKCQELALVYFAGVRNGGTCVGALKPEKRGLEEPQQ